MTWMGDYAVLDAQPGGVFHLDINGVPVRGHFIELDPPHFLGRLVIAGRGDDPGPDPFAATALAATHVRKVDGGMSRTAGSAPTTGPGVHDGHPGGENNEVHDHDVRWNR